MGSTSLYDHGIITVELPSSDPVVLEFRFGGPSVNGRVQGLSPETERPIVTLVPGSEREQNTLLYKRVTVDDSGRFTFSNVPPGEYMVYAWQAIPIGAEQNKKFRDQYGKQRVSILVREGETPEIQMTANTVN
jgi:hypothetical protein